MTALREVLAFFQIDVDDSSLKESEKKVEGFLGTLKQAGRVFAEAFAVEEIKGFLENEIQVGVQAKVMAERLGLGLGELQALQLAAGEAGVSADALTTGLRFLNRNIGEAASGTGEHAALFKKLGISIKDDVTGQARNAGDVLEDLADHLAKTEDTGKRTLIATQLLGRGGAQLIPLLKQGGKAFEEARKQVEELGGGLSEEFVEQAHAAEAATVRLEFSWKSFRSQIASALFPAFGEIVKWLTTITTSVVKFNKETSVLTTAVTFFGGIAAFKMIGGLRELVPLIEKLAKAIGITDVALFGLEIPVWAVIALIGLLYLAFDDVYNLMTGGESVIGDTLDELFGIGSAVKFANDLKEAFSSFLDILANTAGAITQALLIPLEQVFDAAKGIGEALGDIAGGHFGQAVQDLQKAGSTMTADYKKRTDKYMEDSEGIEDDFTLSKAQRNRKRIKRENAGAGAAEYKPGGESFTGPLALPAEHVPTNIYGHPMAGATVVNQTNNTKVDVHPARHLDGKQVGAAVGPGISDTHKRNTAKALTSRKVP